MYSARFLLSKSCFILHGKCNGNRSHNHRYNNNNVNGNTDVIRDDKLISLLTSHVILHDSSGYYTGNHVNGYNGNNNNGKNNNNNKNNNSINDNKNIGSYNVS